MSRYRLSEMDFDEISLVASGDDPEARVVIAKSAAKNSGAKSRHRGTPRPTLSKGDLSQEDQMTEISKDDLPEEVVSYIAELEKSVDEMVDAITQLDDEEVDDEVEEVAELEELDEELDEEKELEPVGKSDAVTISKAEHAALLVRVEQAEAIAKSEREQRRKNEAIVKAESMAFGETDEVAQLLVDIEDASPELAGRVEALLSTANQQVEKSALFSEVGKSLTEFTTTSSLDSMAAEIVKADPSVTQEAAIAQALEGNPALYEEYLKGGSR